VKSTFQSLLNLVHMAVPWLRRLVAGLPPQRTRVRSRVRPCGIFGYWLLLRSGIVQSFRYTATISWPNVRPHLSSNDFWFIYQIGSCDGARLRLSTAAWWFLVLSPDESECDLVSERDRLGLTPNLTTRDLWRSGRWARGNENFVCSFLWDFKSSFICSKILRHGTFRLYFPSERKVCCGFLSPLKILRLGPVRTFNLWVQWQAH
jgi:hypothetical protein